MLNKPKNSNYAAIIVEISTIVPLEGCDFVQAAIILGNQVIVGKDIKVGDIGIYFPLECQLSKEYLSANNLYRKPELNLDNTKKGYFEENGRIRCVKFRGHKSEGLYMPLSSLEFTKTDYIFKLTDEFDQVGDIEICKKYIPKSTRTPGAPGSRKQRSSKKADTKLIDGQFRFHDDTSMLYKNLHRIKPDSLISITYKLHGTSGISSYVLCKRAVNPLLKVLKWIGVPIEDTHYDYIYSSRKVIKNSELHPNAQHFYDVDIWGIADKKLRPILQKGMTFYYEIVGYLPTGAMIQKEYDYGYDNPLVNTILPYSMGVHFGIYIYRITQTNIDGKVFEFTAKQVQDFCKKNGLNAVPLLYYGYAGDLLNSLQLNIHKGVVTTEIVDGFTPEAFLNKVKELFNEKDCCMCVHDVPEEGCVIRIEGLDFEAYKQKSNAFYALETKLLDKGETNLEDEN